MSTVPVSERLIAPAFCSVESTMAGSPGIG